MLELLLASVSGDAENALKRILPGSGHSIELWKFLKKGLEMWEQLLMLISKP